MTKKDALPSTGLAALQQRFLDQSRTAQTYYAVMHAARGFIGSDEGASAWMEEGLPAFEGKSPAKLVREGRSEELLAYMTSLKA